MSPVLPQLWDCVPAIRADKREVVGCVRGVHVVPLPDVEVGSRDGR